MIDGRYTDEEWQAVAAALSQDTPSPDVLSLARQRLERAAARYADNKPLAEQMRGAAKKRDHWQRIHDDVLALKRSINAAERWHAPIWEADDPAEKARALRTLDELALHAKVTSAEYARGDEHLNPRERLNVDVLGVWTDLLGRGFGWSISGPAVRFFQAALGPIVTDAPAPTTVRDILDREKARRLGAPAKKGSTGSDKRAKSKKRSSGRTRAVHGIAAPHRGDPNL